MLRRVDARQLRLDAGISQATVAAALGVPRHYIAWWEQGKFEPKSEAGYRWARFVAGLERHAEVEAECQRAALP